MLRYLLPLIFIFSVCFDSAGQVLDRAQILDGLVKYREAIIKENPYGYELWQKDFDRFTELGYDGYDVYDFNYGYLAAQLYWYNYKQAKKQLKFFLEKPEMIEFMDRDDYSESFEKVLFLDMIFDGWMNYDRQLTISDTGIEIEELLFYEFENNQKILEIGAGEGQFSLVINALYDSMSIFINEIDGYKEFHVMEKLYKNPIIHPRNRIHQVTGEYNDIGIDSVTFDNILIRNTMHHFSLPDAMFNSIHKALDDNGKLLILEFPPELDFDGELDCDEVIPRSEIVLYIERNGFEIIEEIVLGEHLLIKAKKK